MQEWEELLARSEGGDRIAQVRLADCYAQGRGVERSPVQAAAWLRRAAEQGSPEGQSIFGFCCLEGFGVKKDADQAAAWFRKSAEQGCSEGWFGLAICYFSGAGTEQNDRTAADLCRCAAEQGHVKAMIRLGACCLEGRGTARDLGAAEAWLCRAIKTGDAQGWKDKLDRTQALRLLAEAFYARYTAGETKSQAKER